MNVNQAIREVQALVDEILPILDDRTPEVQAGVLAELLARYLADGPPQIRDATLKVFLSFLSVITDQHYPCGGRKLQ
jgi:hypothetical protein